MNAGTPPDKPATVAGDVEMVTRIRDSYALALDKAKQMLSMFTGRALDDDPNLVTIKSVLRETVQNIAALTRAIAALQERDALTAELTQLRTERDALTDLHTVACASIAEVQTALVELRTERDALARDGERWDFVSERKLEVRPSWVVGGKGGIRDWLVFDALTDYGRIIGRGGTPRAALDAALAARDGATGEKL